MAVPSKLKYEISETSQHKSDKNCIVSPLIFINRGIRDMTDMKRNRKEKRLKTAAHRRQSKSFLNSLFPNIQASDNCSGYVSEIESSLHRNLKNHRRSSKPKKRNESQITKIFDRLHNNNSVVFRKNSKKSAGIRIKSKRIKFTLKKVDTQLFDGSTAFSRSRDASPIASVSSTSNTCNSN